MILVISILSSLNCSIKSISQNSGPSIPIYKRTVVRFAGLGEGKKLMGTPDDWVKSLSPFDRKLRMKKNEDVSQEEFLSFVANQVVEWKKDEIDSFVQSIDDINKKLDLLGLKLDLPKDVLLIKTTGNEEGGASYTRQNAIIVPEGYTSPYPIMGILHELFHVMTRNNPEVRESLYSIIGYQPCNDVKLPDSILPRKITNPDAFHNDFFIEVSLNDVPTKVIPIIYSETDQYTGGELFNYLNFKLMVVEAVNGAYQPLIENGLPVLFDVTKDSGYMKKIGRNTDYIIHPEEIMACNFSYMAMQLTDIPNPEILDSMKKVLQK